MRWAPILILLLAGCVSGTPAPDRREAEALARELAGRVAGAPEHCVSAPTSDALRAVDGRTFVTRRGDTIWVSRPPGGGECPGFHALATLIVETHGGQYCRGDPVRAIEPGTSIPGPICLLGDFVPYRRAR